MKRKICEAIPLVASVLLAVGVMTVFHACAPGEDGMWMHCHYVQLDLLYFGIAMAVASLGGMILSQPKLRMAFRAVGMVLAVLTMLLPGTILQMCMMNSMRCHALMKPFAWLMGAVILISEAVLFVTELRVARRGQAA